MSAKKTESDVDSVDTEPVEVEPVGHEKWWNNLKEFAARHMETPAFGPKTVGGMLVEFIRRCENNEPF